MFFFLHSPKKVLGFVNRANTLKIKGWKLCNIKTRWISMLNPLKHLLGEYKWLVVKMHMDVPKNKLSAKNLDLLCDLELGFGLPCIFPMLEVVHMLIKYIQRWDVLIYDFFDVVRSTKVEINWLWCTPKLLDKLNCESKAKTMEGWRVGVCSLIRNTSRVEGHAGASRWGLEQVINGSIIHMDLHKPNNKLVSA
jgi:hypothetical protein